jgi:hypothetical protein
MCRVCLALVLTLLVGCTQESRIETEHEQEIKTDTNFAHLPLILAGIPKSSDISLYEGLPSEFWEPELLERELSQKKTHKLHGYRFYEELITIEGADAEQLTALLSSKKAFRAYEKTKRCGGFYPEYCVEWKKGQTATQCLICLECGDVKMFGANNELHCDFSVDAQQKLKQLLGHYQKNRPVTKSSP